MRSRSPDVCAAPNVGYLMIDSSTVFRYRAYGLTIDSQIALPELVAQADAPPKASPPPDVVIRFSAAPPPFRQTQPIKILGDDIWLQWEDIGMFLVRGGREIWVYPKADVEQHVLRLFLLGTTFAMLLHQRNEVAVFHASVVSIAGQAVAFMGMKGAGKSTLAAALHARGHALLADDILAVQTNPDMPTVVPGFPHIKLWPDSVEFLGRSPTDLPKLRPEVEKRGYRIHAGFAEREFPLHAIYLLGVRDELQFRPIQGSESLLALMPHWYGARFGQEILQALGTHRHFSDCATIAQKVRIYALDRPPSLASIQEYAKQIETNVTDSPRAGLQSQYA